MNNEVIAYVPYAILKECTLLEDTSCILEFICLHDTINKISRLCKSLNQMRKHRNNKREHKNDKYYEQISYRLLRGCIDPWGPTFFSHTTTAVLRRLDVAPDFCYRTAPWGRIKFQLSPIYRLNLENRIPTPPYISFWLVDPRRVDLILLTGE
ncbi:hypothetical protein DINM_003990 [Dirofilaria immitis]|nr:hypothetical protein [Dirofilaria immitis]